MLKGFFVVENTNFNATIVTSEYASRLQALNKVRSVVDLRFTAKYFTEDSRVYSPYQFDIQANTQSGIVSFPENVCWELKYPNFDIVGRGA